MQLAKRFVKAIETGDYAAADDLFVSPNAKFIAGIMKDRDLKNLSASVRAQTPTEWLMGTCELTLADSGVPLENPAGKLIRISEQHFFVVTAQGIESQVGGSFSSVEVP